MRGLRCAILLAAIGASTGLLLAGREVLRQEYLSQGLWGTSAWALCRGALTGAAAGAAICTGATALLSLWSWLIQQTTGRPPASPGLGKWQVPAWATGAIVFLALVTAVAALAVPQGAPRVLGIPYRELIFCLGVLLWVTGTALAAEAAHAGAAQRWFELRWRSVIAAIGGLGLLHGVVLAPSWQALVALAAATTGLSAAALFALQGRARGVDEWATPRIARFARGRVPGVASAIVLVLVLTLSVASWQAARRARAGARHRNVIFIAVDALRGDRVSLLSAHQYRRDLTPNLRRLLAPRAMIFPNAVTSAPWTLPAFSSMFTGLDPREHGAEYRGSVLVPARLTLAELARESGYRTLAVTSGAYVTTLSGMDQGFEHFDDSQAMGQHTISSALVTDKAIRLLKEGSDQPFLLFLHYFDAHWVYQYHPEFPFARDYDGWLREPAERLNQEDFRDFLGIGRAGQLRQPLTPDDVRYLADLYDGEVAYVDQEIGRLLEFVGEQRLWRNTLVLFVADHGEELFDHGNLGHQTTLFQELVRVPLAIVPPSADRQAVVTEPVETRALFCTVLDFLGISQPGGRPGSLLSEPRTHTTARSANHTLAFQAYGVMSGKPVDVWWTSVQDGRWKLIKEHLRGRSMLLDLHRDPAETRNWATKYPEQQARLERELDRMDAKVSGRVPGRPAPEAGQEQQRRLRSLGYLE